MPRMRKRKYADEKWNESVPNMRKRKYADEKWKGWSKFYKVISISLSGEISFAVHCSDMTPDTWWHHQYWSSIFFAWSSFSTSSSPSSSPLSSSPSPSSPPLSSPGQAVQRWRWSQWSLFLLRLRWHLQNREKLHRWTSILNNL